jgi:outer membrane protein OmpA-like peptidoglycan-associated protein
VVAGITVSPSFDPATRDADADGIPDASDKCVNEPEDKDGYQDSDGCPDTDNDADTILDKFDECPDNPEDVDGFEDKDGCPDNDNDNDGVADIADRCPLAPETVNDYRDDDGCPDTPEYGDRDGDGFTDNRDRCPDEAETFNGIEDDDGCPEKGRVSVEKGAIKISERIYFETGRAEIQQRSHSLLDEIAQVILANPKLKKVRIEGHTDNIGSDSGNLRLSQSRAKSVGEYLVSAGVSAQRLDARGFGETYPLVTNDTEEGRAKNRRVEFIIVDQD